MRLLLAGGEETVVIDEEGLEHREAELERENDS
jgi:hypothetical protein